MSTNVIHHDVVLTCISRKLREVERLMIDNVDYIHAKILLEECKANLERIRQVIPVPQFNSIDDSITGLLTICSSLPSVNLQRDLSYRAEHKKTGLRGRPTTFLSLEQLKVLHDQGCTAKEMAKIFKCSVQLVYKRLYASGLHQRDKYSTLADVELKGKVLEMHESFPNSGSKMMAGYMASSGVKLQRHRVRTALRECDPTGTAERWGKTVARRVYRVPMPNALWHLDSHMKLIRWGFATHGCVDGYSRLIVFLHCCTANTAEAVATSFIAACTKFTLPQRVRCDHGLENFHVGIIMNVLRGMDRGSVITGESVHNQRIERLWRDVFKEVASTFYTEFYRMEDAGVLNPTDHKHRCALQMTYLPVINKRLALFQDSWNKHSIRTAHNKTPEQLWTQGVLLNADSDAGRAVFNEQSARDSILEYCEKQNTTNSNGISTVPSQSNGWQREMNLSATEMDEIKSAMSDTANDYTRYTQCVDKLNEITAR